MAATLDVRVMFLSDMYQSCNSMQLTAAKSDAPTVKQSFSIDIVKQDITLSQLTNSTTASMHAVHASHVLAAMSSEEELCLCLNRFASSFLGLLT